MANANSFDYDYARLYTDERGETHLGDGKITLRGESFMGGPPVLIKQLQLAAGHHPQIAHVPAGASYDWHISARRQFIFVIQGEVDFIASDGAVYHAVPGSLILFEDTTGKGHRTRCRGPDDHVALMIPLD